MSIQFLYETQARNFNERLQHYSNLGYKLDSWTFQPATPQQAKQFYAMMIKDDD